MNPRRVHRYAFIPFRYIQYGLSLFVADIRSAMKRLSVKCGRRGLMPRLLNIHRGTEYLIRL